LYLLLVAFWAVIFRDLSTIHGASINIPALVVLMVALYKDSLAAAWFGFVVGVVASAAQPQVMGWHALLMVGLALLASFLKIRLNLDSLKAKVLLIGGAVLLHNLFALLIDQHQNFFSLAVTAGLLGAAYSTVAGWLFFLFKEGLITYQKVKSIF
jgi:rod shape-determining protein MreD